MLPRPPTSTLFPYTTLFRSSVGAKGVLPAVVIIVEEEQAEGQETQTGLIDTGRGGDIRKTAHAVAGEHPQPFAGEVSNEKSITDRKSTRLNSSHTVISYAVF